MVMLRLEGLVCPACRGALEAVGAGLGCRACGRSFGERGAVADLFVEDEGGLAREVTAANEAYHDAIAGGYEADTDTVEIFGEACQARIDGILKQLAADTGRGLLVDVGCGTGNVLLAARTHFAEAIGVDVAVGMLARAEERGLRVVRANAYRLPFADASVDVVTGFALLHHLQDLPRFFAEVARVLRPGGVFYSDWDPNSKLSYGLVRLARLPWIYRPAKALFRCASGVAPDKAQHHEAGNTDAFELAEYHAFGVTCDADRIAAQAKAQGFAQVRVRFHANPPDLETDDWALLPARRRRALRVRGLLAGQWRREHLLPFFLMIARRKPPGHPG